MICQSKHTAGMESRKNRGERMKHRRIWIIIAGVVLIVAGVLGVVIGKTKLEFEGYGTAFD